VHDGQSAPGVSEMLRAVMKLVGLNARSRWPTCAFLLDAEVHEPRKNDRRDASSHAASTILEERNPSCSSRSSAGPSRVLPDQTVMRVISGTYAWIHLRIAGRDRRTSRATPSRGARDRSPLSGAAG